MSDIKKLLSAYAAHHRRSIRGIALDCGVTPATMHMWVSTPGHSLNHSNQQAVERFLTRHGLWKSAETTQEGTRLLAKYGGKK